MRDDERGGWETVMKMSWAMGAMVGAGAATTALGQVTLLEDVRHVELSVTAALADVSTCEDLATDVPGSAFGLFEADRPVRCITSGSIAVGFASHSTTISARGAGGFGASSASIDGLSSISATGVFATSHFIWRFSVGSPTAYTFSASILTSGGESVAMLRTEAGEDVVRIGSAQGETGVNTSGILATGAYRLELEAVSEVGQQGVGLVRASAGWEFHLTLGADACRADFNGDGSLDPDDLADFISGFFASPASPRADFNGDGTADPDDLADYVTMYFAGC